MLDLTFLGNDQIYGSNKLKMFKNGNAEAAITDYAILQGGYVSDDYHTSEGNNLENRTGFYWTKTDDGYNDAHVVPASGNGFLNYVTRRHVGGRPALKYSQIKSIASNKIIRPDGLLEVDCFYLSKKAVSKYDQIALENLYNNNNILRTNDFNTTDSRKWNEYDKGFLANNNYLYEDNGKRYSRIKANACCEEFTLSNGETYHNGEYVWVETNPVKWICDEEKDIAVAKDIIFAGVQFHHKCNYKGDFSRVDIKKYMDQCLAIELERSLSYFSSTDIEKPFTLGKRMK